MADWQNILESADISHARMGADYQRHVEKIEDYYAGRHNIHIEPILVRHYPRGWDKGQMIIYPQPFIRRITDTTATLFHRPPTYEARQPGDPDALDATTHDMQVWDEIDSQVRWNDKLKRANRMARRLQVCLVGPAWRKDKLHLDVIRPSLFSVISNPEAPGDLSAALAVIVHTPAKGFVIWTREEVVHMVLVGEGEGRYILGDQEYNPTIIFPSVTPLEDGQEYPNPYGCIPFVLVRNGPSDDTVHVPLDDSLIDIQEAVTCLCSFHNWLASRGAYINVGKVNDPDRFQGQDAGPDQILGIGLEESLERISAPIDYSGAIERERYLLEMGAAMHGADPAIFATFANAFSGQQSAAKARQDRMDLNETREDQEQDYRYMLTELIALTVKVYNIHVLESQRMAEDLTWTIEFTTPRVDDNVLQQAQAEQIRLDNGTASKAMIMAERKGISVAAAQVELDQIEANAVVVDPDV